MKRFVSILASLSICLSLWAGDFESVRKMKAGAIAQGTILEGVVISDYRLLNTELNPNLEWNLVDLSRTLRTAYIQSSDGSFGYRLVFRNIYSNKLERGSLVKIDVSGCMLQVQKQPECYTISDIPDSRVSVLEKDAPIIVKEKTISQLEDKDIYTFVTLTGLEFLHKQGSFSNIFERSSIETAVNYTETDIHTCATDGWAQLLEDGDGRHIYMQVNSSCYWRRNNIGVPKGVGNVSGVIVTGQNRRYGATFGPYSIRPMERSDISIPKEESSSFTTIVSWRWDRNYDEALNLQKGGNVRWAKSVSDDAIVAEKGKGLLYTDSGASFKLSVEYDARYTTDGDGAGYRFGGAVRFGGDVTDWVRDHKRSAIIVRTSTEGFVGKGLIFNFSMLAGDTGGTIVYKYPAFWTVEYSTDGINYQPTGYKMQLRPLATCPEVTRSYLRVPFDAACGFAEHHVDLPVGLLGQPDLYIRIIPSSDVLVGRHSDPSADINSMKMSSEIKGDVAIRLGMAELKTY